YADFSMFCFHVPTIKFVELGGPWARRKVDHTINVAAITRLRLIGTPWKAIHSNRTETSRKLYVFPSFSRRRKSCILPVLNPRNTSMQIIREPKVYDVCVVGSGAGGGMAAKVLTETGAEVVLLEAGAMWDTEKDSKMCAWPYESPRRGAA